MCMERISESELWGGFGKEGNMKPEILNLCRFCVLDLERICCKDKRREIRNVLCERVYLKSHQTECTVQLHLCISLC